MYCYLKITSYRWEGILKQARIAICIFKNYIINLLDRERLYKLIDLP